MTRWFLRLLLVTAALLACPWEVPAPLVYRPGEGWSYESVGEGGKWQRGRAKDQLDVAQKAFDEKRYGLALKAARRTVKRWPLSEYAAKAQYLTGRCYEAKHNDQKAFNEYQKVLTKFPKTENYQEILQRQFEIANRFLGGQRFRLFGVLPLFRSMDRTAEMYEKIIRNGPYSDIAPQAQLNIGAARERQKDYPLAVKAYTTAADRYHENEDVGSAAVYRMGQAWTKQAKRAEYDQGAAGQAIAAFTDFMVLYPEDSRVEEAKQTIDTLKLEQAKGSLRVARFYEKKHKWSGALVYYNDVLNTAPKSEYAEQAKQRIDRLSKQTGATGQK